MAEEEHLSSYGNDAVSCTSETPLVHEFHCLMTGVCVRGRCEIMRKNMKRRIGMDMTYCRLEIFRNLVERKPDAENVNIEETAVMLRGSVVQNLNNSKHGNNHDPGAVRNSCAGVEPTENDVTESNDRKDLDKQMVNGKIEMVQKINE